MTNTVTGRRIMRTTLRRNLKPLVGGAGLLCLYQAAETSIPLALGFIVDHAVAEGSLLALAAAVAALALIITTVSLSWRFGMRILNAANLRQAHRWRTTVANHSIQPIPRRTDLRSGEVLTIATDDADQTSDIIEVLPQMVGAFIAIALAATVLTLISVPLGLLVIIGTPAIMAILALASHKIGARTREQQRLVARATAKASDLIRGLRPLHGFGGNAPAFRGYRDVSTVARDQSIRVARAEGSYWGLSVGLNALLAASISLLGGWYAFGGDITIGELVAVVGIAQFIIEPLGLFARMPKYVATANASAHRLALALSAPPAGQYGRFGGELAPVLELDAVSYRRLHEVSFDVRQGEFVAVVAFHQGDAHALVELLSLGVPPQSYVGEVRVGGRAISDLDIEELRRILLVNPHDAEVFSGTLRSNITPDGQRSDLSPAISAAMLADVIGLHHAGLEHPIRDRGANLSGGQRQRLSLARALAADPPVLVLHDPTTAVDAVTEQAIAARVARLRQSSATLVITSSPALLDVADRVLVIDGGRVVATGTHRELSAQRTDYVTVFGQNGDNQRVGQLTRER